MLSVRNRKLLSGLALLISIGLFVKQTLLPKGTLWDFGVNDASSHAWLTRHNPYNAAEVWDWWGHSNVWSRFADTIVGLPPVAPPGAVAIFAPLAALSTTVAGILWVAISLTLIALQLFALVRLAGLPFSSARTFLLVACVLAIAPLKIAFLAGNAVVVVAALIIIAVWAARAHHEFTAAVLLALAASMKLQVGLPFILTYAFLGRPRITIWGIAGTLAVMAIGFIGLHLGGTAWFQSWASTLHSVNAPGGLNDFGAANPFNYQLLNLQLPVNYLFASRQITNVISIAIGGVLTSVLLAQLWLHRPVRQAGLATHSGERDELLVMSIVAPLLLLPVYHRYYDGVILTLTLAWAFRESCRANPVIPRFLGLLLLVALLPPGSTIPKLGAHLPDALVRSTVYNLLIISYRVWIILLITATLLYELRRRRNFARPCCKGGNQ
jgi:hypothetical protein